MEVNGRGYTHSIKAGVALRQPSCQFSTGTGMQVSLMVSWQRKDKGGPLSSSSWALLWTVSTTEGGGGAGKTEAGVVLKVGGPGMQIWGQEAEEGKKTRKTQEHEVNIEQEKSQVLSGPTSFGPQLLIDTLFIVISQCFMIKMVHNLLVLLICIMLL